MKITKKKYYSANEITKLLNIALYQLRYLETKILGLSNYKIKNRKYYTANDFELFQKHLNIDKNMSNFFPNINIDDNIDILLINFNDLSLQIKKSLLIILDRVYSITNLILYWSNYDFKKSCKTCNYRYLKY